ncbi:MAG TPA: radical SAM family heme chaperone HemW [Oligoflexus sp.]|uniref:radical SAM family heme chaperone HemW n=1 Tax=Oligoflexus sp. TaxID=1971216 RepID=UPI002D7F1540|nr:radical SAM family heme chaperone HemW [Oligoflexus sp.]HET9239832.1 radical SAM family heme chaperone HemW [Oligoflexus sp.]
MNQDAHSIGLYLHIPFCSRLCHYCDFVKTARFAADDPASYVRMLKAYADAWLPVLGLKLRTVFLGGGTPSLLDEAYGPLMESLRSWLLPEAEITMEANPEHVTPERVKIWADLGINRLSLGVQSFQARGLKFLTREHSPERARDAAQLARSLIPNVNLDLIYGWQGQELSDWEADLHAATALDIQHLSLYTLTYEGRTPLARMHRRGVVDALTDERLESMYLMACDTLRAKGFEHEEVSNWHKPGFASVHNSIYWHAGSYIGLGNGAHSFLAEHGGPFGTRWSQDPNLRLMQDGQSQLVTRASLDDLLRMPGVHVETERGASEWLLETVSSGLRTGKGINVNAICARTGYNFRPRPSLDQALRQGLMQVDAAGILTLREEEWYRETGWALEVSLSFVAP